MKVRLLLAALILAIAAGSIWTYFRVRGGSPTARAEQLLDHGDVQGALLTLRTVTQGDQKNVGAFMLLGRVHERMGDFTSAERDFKRARALGADRAEIAARLAPIYLDTRRYQVLLDETPSTAPDNAVAARLLAFRSRAYAGLNNPAAAASALNKARALAPALDDVLLADARAALSANDPAKAEAAVDGALKDNPVSLEALLLKAQFRVAAKQPGAALTYATRAVDAAPLLAAPLLARARILLDSGELEKARVDLTHLEALGYHNPEATYLLAVIASRQGKFVDAAARFDSISAVLGAFPRAPYDQAIVALGRNLPSTAVDLAARYVTQFPSDADGVRLLARAHLANNRPDLAANVLSQAIARNVNDPGTMTLYGGVLARQGNLGKAEAALGSIPAGAGSAAQLAELETRRGDYAAALLRLERARSVAPGDTAVLENLVQAQIAKGDTEAAATTLETLKAKAGSTEAVGIFTGMVAMARRDIDGAIDALSNTVKAFPNSVVANVDLARVLALNGQVNEARGRLRAVLANNPADPLILGTLVRLEIGAGRPDVALEALDAARKAAPSDETLAIMAADFLIGAGDGRAAAGILTGLRTPEAPRPARWAALARAYKATGQTQEEAASYRSLVASSTDPDVAATASLSLADLSYRTKDADAARQVLDEAIARTPANLALLSSRVQLEMVAQGRDAARAMAAKLRSDPAQMPAAAFLAGDLAMRQRDFQGAIAAFKAEQPRTPALAIRIAEAQALAGDDKAAASELAPIADSDAAAPILAQIAVRAKNWPEAAQQLERASHLAPNDPALLNNLAWAYLQTDDPRAVSVARRAYLLDPRPDAADTLGWILTQQNGASTAVPILETASAQRPQDPNILFHLAVALAKTGNAGSARDTVQRALRASNFDERDAAQAFASSLPAASTAQ